MRIRITSAYCFRPGIDVSVGEVVEATKQEALYAFALRRAVPVDDDGEAADAAGNQEQRETAKQPVKGWGRRK